MSLLNRRIKKSGVCRKLNSFILTFSNCVYCSTLLAKTLFKKGICYFKDQADFKLAKAMAKTPLYAGFASMNFENDILEDVIVKTLK